MSLLFASAANAAAAAAAAVAAVVVVVVVVVVVDSQHDNCRKCRDVASSHCRKDCPNNLCIVLGT